MTKWQYTCVDRKFEELGELPEPGKRSDWEEVYELCKDPLVTEREIFDQFPKLAVRYGRAIRQARADARRDEFMATHFDREVHIITGDAGTGKDFDVRAQYGAENVYELCRDENGAVWWDGYTGQDVLLISDFKWWLTRARLLNICGDRMVRTNIKCGTEWWTGTKVVITSNYKFQEWYNNWERCDSVVDPAFTSRITTHKHYRYAPGEQHKLDTSILTPEVVWKENHRQKKKRKQRKRAAERAKAKRKKLEAAKKRVSETVLPETPEAVSKEKNVGERKPTLTQTTLDGKSNERAAPPPS